MQLAKTGQMKMAQARVSIPSIKQIWTFSEDKANIYQVKLETSETWPS